MRELGVGIVYWPALAPVLRSRDLCAVVELEPQSLWEKVAGPHGYRYRLNEPLLDEIAQLPHPKLMHGVGQPVAGTTDDPVAYLPLLRRMVDRLDPAWVSEHLSFNRVMHGANVVEAGFLLPPVQSPAAARVAAQNIGRYSAALNRPFAFETGVNYLRPRDDELVDGQFFAAVAEHADCGILLDLHNLWCNERNGRQSVLDALSQMPLDRVWEVHLAGGMPFRGYWLDAHSGGVSPALLELAADVIARLPQLGALIFEIIPEHLHAIGLDGVQRELEQLHALWQRKPVLRVRPDQRMECATARIASSEDVAETRDAERRLQARLIDRSDSDSDDGVSVLRALIGEFRAANLAKTMRYTLTALLSALGSHETHALLDQYFRQAPPDAYPAIEAERFSRFLDDRRDMLGAVRYLHEVLAFEAALLSATVRAQSTDLEWSVDPTALLDELQSGRLPDNLPPQRSRMHVTAD
jgi:uncharacterized protein (UPF0276 family)